MADPYAERGGRVSAGIPAGPPPWLGAVAERCELLGPGAEPEGGRPLGIVVCDDGPLAPIARLDAPRAAMFAALATDGPVAVTALYEALRSAADPLYLLKHGPVAGPAGEPGALEVDAELLCRVLDADRRGAVVWEVDPDFGYEVAAEVADLGQGFGAGGAPGLALCPRLLYAAHDRVYEYAERVATSKRRWAEHLTGVADLPPEVRAAVDWPPTPTGERWKD